MDGTAPVAEVRDRCVFATRQLAKRQITWLRAMPQRQVVACDVPDAIEQVVQLAQRIATGFAQGIATGIAQRVQPRIPKVSASAPLECPGPPIAP